MDVPYTGPGTYTQLVDGWDPQAAGLLLRSGDTTCLCGFTSFTGLLPLCPGCELPMCPECESDTYAGLCVICEGDDDAISYWRSLALAISTCLCCHRPVAGYAFCIRCAKAGCTPTQPQCGGRALVAAWWRKEAGA